MDNRYTILNCPPRMSDGRHFTDYHSAYTLDDYYQKMFHLSSNEHEYRKKLQNDAEKIINSNINFFINTNKCNCSTTPCKIENSLLPEYYNQFDRKIIMTDLLPCNTEKLYRRL